MELNLAGQNCFWINEPLLRGEIGGDPAFGSWKNWGGYKTWLAPQSRWPDPNAQSEAMDNVEWDVLSHSEAEIELRGPIIPWSGLRLGRRLSLAADEPKVRARESMTNAGAEPQTWAVWAVAQFPVPGWAVYPAEGARRALAPPARSFDGDRLRFVGDSKWKTGALVSEGWGEYRADSWRWTFRAAFAPHASLPHPDDCNLETWSNSAPGYMELEWLGPLVTLEPGESWEWGTEWAIAV